MRTAVKLATPSNFQLKIDRGCTYGWQVAQGRSCCLVPTLHATIMLSWVSFPDNWNAINGIDKKPDERLTVFGIWSSRPAFLRQRAKAESVAEGNNVPCQT